MKEKQTIAFKVLKDIMFTVKIDGTIEQFDGKKWRVVKNPDPLLKEWVEVEIEWKRRQEASK